MKMYQRFHSTGGMLAILVAGYLFIPYVSAGELSGTEWKVTRGDTLYAIGRAVYPKDARMQARLRQDIMKLNPAVFDNGANNMKVGDVLKLPDYVASKSVPSETDRPAPTQEKVTPVPAKPFDSAKRAQGALWKVKRGDTLYGICRTVFPGDARKQAQLGRDIKKLNPSVFSKGADTMNVGVVLKLPDYVPPESVPAVKNEPAPAPEPVEVAPKPEPTPEPVAEEVAPEPAPVPAAKPQPATPRVEKRPDTAPSRAESGAVVSLGFSSGGEKLLDVSNGPDIFAGTGAQLRLGYEQMFEHGSGYRISLGLQYYTLIEQRDVSFRDVYLQLAYQYRSNPVVYGIGVVMDTGAKLESDVNADFDSAVGGTAYLEYVGSGIMNGWGFGITSLNIKEKDTGTSFGASRAELYYRWRF